MVFQAWANEQGLLDLVLRTGGQCWGHYFLKVTRYILLFTLKMICILQLHIT